MDHEQFRAKFDFGSSGEKVVGSWLGSKRVFHFALHPFDLLEDGGPRMVMDDQTTLPCPDFLCWGLPPHPGAPPPPADQCEVKRFRKWWNDWGTEQTGIEKGKVTEYKRLAGATGKKVYAYFLHMNELMQGEGLFFGDISALTAVGETTPLDSKTLVMFNKADLVLLADAEALAWHGPG